MSKEPSILQRKFCFTEVIPTI